MRPHKPVPACRRAALAFALAAAAALPRAQQPAAPPPPAADAPLPASFMRASEIRPGMLGKGRTVVQGYTISEFDAEILGVERGAIAGSDMIIAKLRAPYLENHGVVAGMSGSPVYIDGRLIGAVAYGWIGSYKPYAGITPIEDMWSIWRSIGQKAEDGGGGVAEGSTEGVLAGGANEKGWDWRKAGQDFEARFKSAQSAAAAPLRFDDMPELAALPGGMRPLSAPLILSGGSPSTVAHLNAGLRMLGMDPAEPMAGALGGAPDGDTLAQDGMAPPPMEGGSSLAVALLRGDLNLAATGTVTYCDGEHLLGFGHPMSSDGPIAAPMSQSYIFGFMQSYQRSFKMGSVRDDVGTLVQDSRFGVAGTIGAAPRPMPMTVSVTGDGAFRARDYKFTLFDARTIMPILATTAFSEAYSASAGENLRATIRAAYTIRISDGRQISRRGVLTTDMGGVSGAVFALMRDLSVLQENPFRRAKITGIEASLGVARGIRHEDLVDCRPAHESCAPGETLRLEARFEGYQTGIRDQGFEVKIPADLPEGRYIVHVVDASNAASVELRNDPGRYMARNYDQLIDAMGRGDFPEDELRVYLFAPSVDAEVWDRRLPGAPASIQGVVAAAASDESLAPAVGRLVSMQVIPHGMAVTANTTLAIEVERRKGP